MATPNRKTAWRPMMAAHRKRADRGRCVELSNGSRVKRKREEAGSALRDEAAVFFPPRR